MSILRPPEPAKLIVGCIMQSKGLLDTIADDLVKAFGAIDLISPWLPFDYTDYYHKEMGRPLSRRIFAFKPLIEQHQLVSIKLKTMALEKKFTWDEKRSINIDPGYLLRSRLILATGKDYSHRIYIGESIYADLTLIYQNGAFQKLPWSYPDYSAPEMLNFLTSVRHKYIDDLNREKSK